MTADIYYVDHRYNEPPVAGETYRYGNIQHQQPSGEHTVLRMVTLASGSDYSGCSYTKSNYEALKQEFPDKFVDLYGGYSTYALAVIVPDKDADWPEELKEAMDALDSYPVYDDDHLSELEMNLENEAWEDYGRSDFKRALGLVYEEFCERTFDDEDGHDRDDLDELPDQTFDELWRKGVEHFNVNGGSGYVIETGCTVHFYVKEWIDSFKRDMVACHDECSMLVTMVDSAREDAKTREAQAALDDNT